MKPTQQLLSSMLAGVLLATFPAGSAVAALELPEPARVPQPGSETDRPYAPRPILPGGIVIPLYPPDSPRLNQEKIRQAELYNLTRGTPGRIQSVVNIHNPSIEVHTVGGEMNTGAAVILAAGGGHNTLNVGTESADFVPFFFNDGHLASAIRRMVP